MGDVLRSSGRGLLAVLTYQLRLEVSAVHTVHKILLHCQQILTPVADGLMCLFEVLQHLLQRRSVLLLEVTRILFLHEALHVTCQVSGVLVTEHCSLRRKRLHTFIRTTFPSAWRCIYCTNQCHFDRGFWERVCCFVTKMSLLLG